MRVTQCGKDGHCLSFPQRNAPLPVLWKYRPTEYAPYTYAHHAHTPNSQFLTPEELFLNEGKPRFQLSGFDPKKLPSKGAVCEPSPFSL